MMPEITLENMPYELILKILSYLSPVEIVIFSRISTAYNSIIVKNYIINPQFSSLFNLISLIQRGTWQSSIEELPIKVLRYKKLFPQLIKYVQDMPSTVNDCSPYAANLDGYRQLCEIQLYNIKQLDISNEKSLLQYFPPFFSLFIDYVTNSLNLTLSNSALEKFKDAGYVLQAINKVVGVSHQTSPNTMPDNRGTDEHFDSSEEHYKKIVIFFRSMVDDIKHNITLKRYEISIHFLFFNHSFLLFILMNNFSKEELETIINSLTGIYIKLNGDKLIENFEEVSNFLGTFSSLNAEIKTDFFKLLSQGDERKKLETVCNIDFSDKIKKNFTLQINLIFSIKLLIVKNILIKERKDIKSYLLANQIKGLKNNRKLKQCQFFYSHKDFSNTFIVFLRILNVIPLKNISLYPNLFALISLALNKATGEQLFYYEEFYNNLIGIMKNDDFLEFFQKFSQEEKSGNSRDSYQLNFYRFLQKLFALSHATFDFSKMVLNIFHALCYIISEFKKDKIYAIHQAMLEVGMRNIINLLFSPSNANIDIERDIIQPVNRSQKNNLASAMLIIMYVEYYFFNENSPPISLSVETLKFLNKKRNNFAFYISLTTYFSSMQIDHSPMMQKACKFFTFLDREKAAREQLDDNNNREKILDILNGISMPDETQGRILQKIEELKKERDSKLHEKRMLKHVYGLEDSDSGSGLDSLQATADRCQNEIDFYRQTLSDMTQTQTQQSSLLDPENFEHQLQTSLQETLGLQFEQQCALLSLSPSQNVGGNPAQLENAPLDHNMPDENQSIILKKIEELTDLLNSSLRQRDIIKQGYGLEDTSPLLDSLQQTIHNCQQEIKRCRETLNDMTQTQQSSLLDPENSEHQLLQEILCLEFEQECTPLSLPQNVGGNPAQFMPPPASNLSTSSSQNPTLKRVLDNLNEDDDESLEEIVPPDHKMPRKR